MDQKALLDHQFLIAAYAVTGLGLRGRAQKRSLNRQGR